VFVPLRFATFVQKVADHAHPAAVWCSVEQWTWARSETPTGGLKTIERNRQEAWPREAG